MTHLNDRNISFVIISLAYLKGSSVHTKNMFSNEHRSAPSDGPERSGEIKNSLGN